MSLMKQIAASSRGGWRLAGSLLAAALLMPLPAMALTFTSNWQGVTAVSGQPTQTAATFTDSTDNSKQEDDLFVNLGNYQGATKTAVSAIALARNITVSGPSEAIDFAHQFASQFKQAGVNVAVAIFDNQGHLVAVPITFSQSTNSTNFATISANQSATQTIKGGNYVLSVGIAYNTNNKIGGWKTISQHHFEFEDHNAGNDD
jgi:hypothetical protein